MPGGDCSCLPNVPPRLVRGLGQALTPVVAQQLAKGVVNEKGQGAELRELQSFIG